VSKRSKFDTINKALRTQAMEALEKSDPESAVLVEAPPGAGKSTLITTISADILARHPGTLPIVSQTNEQADDLVAGLLKRFPHLTVGRLVGTTGPSAAIVRLLASGVVVGSHADDSPLAGADVIVGTARKWQYERSRLAGNGVHYEFGLIDESYQMRSDSLLGISSLFERLLCVGDPGQLDPFSTIDDSLWRGLAYSPTRAAMATLRAFRTDLQPILMPTSWRLTPSAADVVSKAFYPYASFDAGTAAGDRRLEWKRHRRGSSTSRSALEAAVRDGWAYVELEERFTPRTDEAIAETLADLVAASLATPATVVDELNPSGRPLTPDRLAVVAAHNDQVHAVRYQLAQQGVDPDSIVVSTANKIQGREYDLVFAWHPLAGRRDATTFHLEAGRMCVMLSRHRQACVVVGRAGADRLLSEFPDAEPIFLDEPEKFPDGWQANYEVLEHLGRHRV
jgi:superfamily I DNA/RNA helicase